MNPRHLRDALDVASTLLLVGIVPRGLVVALAAVGCLVRIGGRRHV